MINTAALANRRAAHRRLYGQKPEAWRARQLVQRYGITIEEYDRLLAKQHGVCAICRRPRHSQRRRLSTDHDHRTGRVRGILCTSCNNRLGILESVLGDALWREKAEAYLASPTND